MKDREKRCSNCKWCTIVDGGLYCLPDDEIKINYYSCRFWEEGEDLIKLLLKRRYWRSHKTQKKGGDANGADT